MEIKERTGKEKSTLARYQDMLDSRINPYLGKTPVDEITGDMLDDFYAMLLKPGQNKKTGRRTFPQNGAGTPPCDFHHYGTRHPQASDCVQPLPRCHAACGRPADAELLPARRSNTDPSGFGERERQVYTLIHVLMLYGIRRGECAGIKLSAVDLRGKTITICSCVMYDPKKREPNIKAWLAERCPREAVTDKTFQPAVDEFGI